MEGREFIKLSKVRQAAARQQLLDPHAQKQLVFIGVLCEKRDPKASRTGETFGTWRISDLNDATLSLLLFGSANTAHWKATIGTVFAILAPRILPIDEKQTSSLATLSVSSADHLLELGAAMDMSICRGVRKDGSKCVSVIDARQGPFCSYHVAAAYKESKAQRLQLTGGQSLTVKDMQAKAMGGRAEKATWTSAVPGKLVPIPQQKGLLLKGDGSVVDKETLVKEAKEADGRSQLQLYVDKGRQSGKRKVGDVSIEYN